MLGGLMEVVWTWANPDLSVILEHEISYRQNPLELSTNISSKWMMRPTLGCWEEKVTLAFVSFLGKYFESWNILQHFFTTSCRGFMFWILQKENKFEPKNENSQILSSLPIWWLFSPNSVTMGWIVFTLSCVRAASALIMAAVYPSPALCVPFSQWWSVVMDCRGIGNG